MALSVWQKFVTDGSGNPISGASVEVRDPGTTTKNAIYKDRAGTTQWTNNVATTDADGFVQLYVAAGRYDIFVDDGAGHTVTYDDVYIGSAIMLRDVGKTIGDIPEYEDDGAGNPVVDHPNMPLVGGIEVVDKSAGNINTIHQFLASEYVDVRSNAGGGPFDEDVSASVPSGAKGALIKVIVQDGGGGSGSIVLADRAGNFGSIAHYRQNAYTNYSADWVGSMLFAPFFTGKTFRWKTQSNSADPDSNVKAYVALIGWWK